MMAVTAIHQRLAKAVARVGAMVEGRKNKRQTEAKREMWGVEVKRKEQAARVARASLTGAQDEGWAITYL